MRFEKIHIHGLGPFADAELDLTQIPAGVIAVTGANGAGKSTLCELFSAAGYRTTRTHGDLVGIAQGRDSYVEAVVANGQRWRIRHSVDCVSKKGESVAFDEAGHPAPETKSAKVTAFDAWAGKKFSDPSVYYTGPFAAQLETGIIGMTPAQRMDVILRAGGISRYETMAKQCRERASKSSASLETIVARIVDEKARGLDVEAAQAELDAARCAEGSADAALAMAKAYLARIIREQERLVRLQQDAEETRARRTAIQQRLEVARAKVAELQRRAGECADTLMQAQAIRDAVARLATIALQVSDAQATQARVQAEADAAGREKTSHEQTAKDAGARSSAAAKRAKDRRDELDAALMAARKDASETQEKLANNRMLLGQADEIRAAVTRNQELVEEAARIGLGLAQSRRDLAEATKDVATHERRKADAFERETKARQRIAAAESRLVDKIAVEKAVASLESLRETLERAKCNTTGASDRLEDMRSKRVSGAEERIGALRGALEQIRDLRSGFEDAPRIASAEITVDNYVVQLAVKLPGQIRTATEAVLSAMAAERAAADRLAEAEHMAARVGEMQQAEAELQAANADAAAAEHDGKTEQLAIEQSKACAEQAKPAIVAGEKRLGEIAKEREPLALLVKLADKLAIAEERIRDLTPLLETQRAKVVQTEASIAAMPDVDPEVQAADLQASEEAAKATAASERVALARTELDRLAGALWDLSVERDKLQPLTDQLPALTKAEALASDLDSQATAAEAEKAAIEAEFATVPDPGAVELPATDAAEAAVRQAEADARATSATVAVAHATHVAALERQDKLQALETERTGIEAALADWTLLAESLGRTGLQAAEVDAAGPELTALTNDLLHRCVGTRWTVRWETKRLDADGKRELEDCDLKVLDTVEGRDASGKAYSPGQRALIELAASLALTQYSCRKLGVDAPTIVRDESSSGLSPDASRAYVEMLKKASKYIGATHVLFITHNPEMWDLADSRIVIENGSIRTAA